MLAKRELARRINGPALDKEIDWLARKGWLDAAQILSARVNRTVDWEALGDSAAPYSILASRGEAVVFFDQSVGRVYKLRGREENGFGGAGFGCILMENEKGRLDLAPGTLQQAIKREDLAAEEFGFACEVEATIDGEDGLLLSQRFISGVAPTAKDVETYFLSLGWESLSSCRDLAIGIRPNAWRRGDVIAVDANETNLVKSTIDGRIHPIDLIVWRCPAFG